MVSFAVSLCLGVFVLSVGTAVAKVDGVDSLRQKGGAGAGAMERDSVRSREKQRRFKETSYT